MPESHENCANWFEVSSYPQLVFSYA
jgi:hypothetical protein